MMAMPLLARRILALLLLFAALAALWLFLAQPVMARFALYRQSMAQSDEYLARYRRMAGGREQLERALEKARRARASSGQFLQGSSTAIIAASLQNDAKKIIAASGGTLKSTQLLQHEDEKDFRRVTIRVNMSGGVEATMQIFHAIESANPYLFLGNVQIRAPRISKRRRTRARTAEGVLQVRYDVYGFMRAAKQ